MKSLLGLIGGTLAFCGLTIYPIRILAEQQGWEAPQLTSLWGVTAAVLCLVPTALTLVWARWAYKGRPQEQFVAVMGGTAVRMFVVLGGAMLLFLTIKEYAYQRFWIFVVAYYLFTLALEMIILVRGQPAQQAESKN